jgi:hypothetical protein
MAYQKSKVSKFEGGSFDRLPVVGFEYCHQVSNVPGEQIGPSELAEGELAVNAADGCLFVKKPSGDVGVVPGAVGFSKIVTLTQSAYDAITATASSTTLYIVTPNPS